MFTIDLKEILDVDVYICDVRGQIIRKHAFSNNQKFRLTSPDQAGTYFIKILDKKKNRYSIRKLVVF